MNITSRQLKAFLLTAQHQSFSRAAEQLFITQSGMSVLGPRVRWVDIAARKLVGSPPDAPVQELVDEHLRRVGRHQPPEIVCNYLETQIAMVESGAGLAVMPTLALPACLKRRVTLHAL